MDTAQRLVDATAEEKLGALKKLWPSLTKDLYQDDQWTRYLQYLDFELARLSNLRGLFSIDNLQDALTIVETLRLNAKTPKKEIASANLCSVPTHDRVTNTGTTARSLELVARLWLTVNVDSFHLTPSYVYMQTSSVAWPEKETLGNILTAHFERRNPQPSRHQSRRIRTTLNMAYLETRHGFQINWTHNLADHLAIDWKYRTITIYEHLICLWNHLESSEECPIPKAILEEAIDTLNLLFPSESRATQDLLRKHGRSFWKLGYCRRTRVLDLDGYHYWKNNVVELMDVMEEPARGLQQFLLDKEQRNMLEFATFWTAAVVGFLTILSIVFGTVATVYSIKQYDVAVAGYSLALAQACADPNISLPKFCP